METEGWRTNLVLKNINTGTFLAVQWLWFQGLGLIPGQGTKIPPALGLRNQNVKKKQKGNKFNEDFKSGTH